MQQKRQQKTTATLFSFKYSVDKNVEKMFQEKSRLEKGTNGTNRGPIQVELIPHHLFLKMI